MANAKKLPSGNWRCRATKIVNGKKTTKSFTAKAKKEAERLADEWQNHIDMIGTDSTTMTVEEAIKEYINIKSNVLSASTIYAYKKYLKNSFDDIKNLKLYQLNSIVIQKSINTASLNLSTKTLKNRYGLLTATLKMFYPELIVSITFPPSRQNKKCEFTKDYLSNILSAIKDEPIELPALLAMCLSCRASEVAGLKWTDVDFKKRTVTIQRAKLYTENGYIIQERTKTTTSTRVVGIPDILYDKLKTAKMAAKNEYIVTTPPNHYWQMLNDTLKKNNVKGLSFHQLRHITASIMLNIGIDNKTAQSIGGWSTDVVLKSVYQHTFEETRKKASQDLNNYFNDLSKNIHKRTKKYKVKRYVS